MVRRFFRQLVRAVIADDIDDVAAMLAYYAVFALFPMVVFVGSLALLVIPVATLHEAVALTTRTLPAEVGTIVGNRVDAMVAANHPGFAIGGAVLALWAASRSAAALSRALNRIHGIPGTRTWLRRQLVAIGTTLAVAVIDLVALALLVVTPWLTHRLRLDAHATELGIVRWVGAGLLVMVVWSLLYVLLPDTRRSRRRTLPGAIVGVILWLGSSALFGIYLEHFGSYETTYGALGTAIIFLIWLWLSNIALLFGAEINEVLGDVRQQHSRDRSRLRGPHLKNSVLPRDHEEVSGVRGAGVGERVF